MSSINNGGSDEQEPRVVEMASIRIHTTSREEACNYLQSTGFNSPAATPLNLSKSPVVGLPMEDSSSDREDLSCASTTSGSSLGAEEHRNLTQSLILHPSQSQDHYCSFSSGTCSDSDQSSSSTLEDQYSYSSTDTGSSSPYFEEDYCSDDGHYNLIQLPESRQDYWVISEFDSDEEYSSAAEIEYDVHPRKLDTGQEPGAAEEKREFCVQCHVWPEVTECTGKV